jgi:hypothetical protein
LVTAAILGAPCASAQASSRSDWLIVQSAADPLALTGTAAARRAPGTQVMAGSDCAEFRPGVFVRAKRLAAPAPGPRPAGSYTKRCTPKAGSVAALGVTIVDPSFDQMRVRPVNFDGRDILTQRQSGFLLRPWYTPSPNDPREGLRVAVDDVVGPRRTIVRDCTQPEVARNADFIAIACATQQIADAPLYQTTLYRARDLKPVRILARCRKPRFGAARLLLCDAQSVSAQGEISVRLRQVPL